MSEDNLSGIMMSIGGMMDGVPEGVAGYRERMIGQGFNETAAELMATQYHQMVVSIILHHWQKWKSRD